MFQRARLRLTLLYIGLFAFVLGVFSVVFYVMFAAILAPTFDLAPELTNEQAAEVAYQATIGRVGVALVLADVAIVTVVGLAAWVLASRTLRPIREAHLRQRRFVADASHEMRTPLAGIRARAEAALTGGASAEEMRTALVDIVRLTDRLARVTNDLLLLARTDERLLGRPPETFDLSVVVAEAVEAFAASNPARRPARVVLAPDLRVSADPDEVERVVANLLDNAFRHGGEGVAVSVSTVATEREVIVAVDDDGPGIAAADIARIFEPFYRVRADATSPDGSGLGLAIARSIAERNGGRLSVASRPGVGSSFRLTLPRFR